jgi:hypothetical protein
MHDYYLLGVNNRGGVLQFKCNFSGKQIIWTGQFCLDAAFLVKFVNGAKNNYEVLLFT